MLSLSQSKNPSGTPKIVDAVKTDEAANSMEQSAEGSPDDKDSRWGLIPKHACFSLRLTINWLNVRRRSLIACIFSYIEHKNECFCGSG